MSLLSRDELRVMLARNQLQLMRLASSFTLKGRKIEVLDKRIVPLDGDAEETWGGALKLLEAVMAGYATKPELASIVVSNQFARYAIVEADGELKNDLERLAYVKLRLATSFGTDIDSWEFRLDQQFPGAPFVVSAIDGKLLSSLRDLCAHAGVRLRSVQPCFMKGYNKCRPVLKNQNAGFMVYENGFLCLAWLKDGFPSSIRTIKAGADWGERLGDIIDREVLLSESDLDASEIFLLSFGRTPLNLANTGRWRITEIKPYVAEGLCSHLDDQHAVAIYG